MAFPPTEEKTDAYQEVIGTLDSLISSAEGKYRLDDIGKMALIATVVKRAFPGLVFVGFYRVVEPDLLQIGPCQGDVIACGSISFNQGVCGECASSLKTITVPDVSKFPGYIACDTKTRSEIVVPVKTGDKLRAVFDLDSPEVAGFDDLDKKYLELIVSRFLT